MWSAVEATMANAPWIVVGIFVVFALTILAALAISTRGSEPAHRPVIIRALAELLWRWRK